MAESYDLDPNSDEGDPRWIIREPEGEAPSGSWATATLDIGEVPTAGAGSIPTAGESQEGRDQQLETFLQPARRTQVYVGGVNQLNEMLRASDKVRTRLLRRDLRWMQAIVSAAGMEIALVREAREDD